MGVPKRRVSHARQGERRAHLALSVPKLDLGKDFDGPAAMAAMKDKTLAQGELAAIYVTNPDKGAVIPKQ